MTPGGVVKVDLLITGARCLLDARVEIRDGRIASVSGRETEVPLNLASLAEVSPANGRGILLPGFIDLQVNGLGGVDVPTAALSRDTGPWFEIGRSLAAGGVTSWLPTIVTRPLGDYPLLLANLSELAHSSPGGPAILGAHLEGPFLGDRPGAHRREWLVPVDPGFLRDLPPVVRLVTLAPEVRGAPEGAGILAQRGVTVSIGHTAATREQFASLRSSGATIVTHLFNAMTGIHHRRGGVALWALNDPDLDVCVIGDSHHVCPDAIRLIRSTRPAGRLILVSDSVAHLGRGLTGAGDGLPARLPDGTLAGSTVRMAGCLRTLMATGADLREGVRTTSSAPARALGLTDRGRLEPGMRADMVLLGPDLRTRTVWASGRRIHG